MSTKNQCNNTNVLKALSYLSQGMKMKSFGDIHAIFDNNNMVHFIITEQERKKVLETKSIHYDEEKKIAVMLNTPFIQQQKKQHQVTTKTLFND